MIGILAKARPLRDALGELVRSRVPRTLNNFADALMASVLVCLPWSTTAVVVLIPLWLILALATTGRAMIKREALTPFCGIPLLLWCLAALGMLWGNAPWHDRLAGLGGFHKLLCIPILVAQFRSSRLGWDMVIWFLASCTLVLIASWILFFFPSITWRANPRLAVIPVPAKEYIFQSGIFVMAAFGLLNYAAELWRSRRPRLALALVVFAGAFIANIVFVITGRTALVAIPVLLLVSGFRQMRWKGVLAAGLGAAALAGTVWLSSAYIRHRVVQTAYEVGAFEQTEQINASGVRLEYWKKSIEFLRQAPLFGHGTGEIRSVFLEGARGKTGPAATVTDNPHNQILAVALQLGALGICLLLAMWCAHVLLFAGRGLACTLGLIVVVHNVVGSLFNSYLFEFGQGWLYVLGVGVLGGMALREADLRPGRFDHDRIALRSSFKAAVTPTRSAE